MTPDAVLDPPWARRLGDARWSDDPRAADEPGEGGLSRAARQWREFFARDLNAVRVHCWASRGDAFDPWRGDAENLAGLLDIGAVAGRFDEFFAGFDPRRFDGAAECLALPVALTEPRSGGCELISRQAAGDDGEFAAAIDDLVVLTPTAAKALWGVANYVGRFDRAGFDERVVLRGDARGWFDAARRGEDAVLVVAAARIEWRPGRSGCPYPATAKALVCADSSALADFIAAAMRKKDPEPSPPKVYGPKAVPERAPR